jgi:homoserine acetyltransferase
MKLYFSGFCLQNEQNLFSSYQIKNEFCVSGFSYGAIKAFEYTLNSKNRVDTLQLFSPAYFNDKDTKYIRLQLMFFKKDPELYCKNFLKNCTYNSDISLDNYFTMGTYEQLEELLTYNWDKEKLEYLSKKGINIEVYLGKEDKIIDSNKAKEFFLPYATIYFIKEKGHIL